MLAPDGRAILLDALRPPPGYGLGRAVATTFTLDLTAALVVPLAFATSQLGDSRDPIAVMEAVRSCAERVDVFCQAGNIVVPRQASDLVAFVEPMVHQVRRARPPVSPQALVSALRGPRPGGAVPAARPHPEPDPGPRLGPRASSRRPDSQAKPQQRPARRAPRVPSRDGHCGSAGATDRGCAQPRRPAAVRAMGASRRRERGPLLDLRHRQKDTS